MTLAAYRAVSAERIQPENFVLNTKSQQAEEEGNVVACKRQLSIKRSAGNGARNGKRTRLP